MKVVRIRHTAFTVVIHRNPEHFFSLFYSIWRYVGIAVGVLFSLLVLVIACCCCLPCCFLAKRRTRRGVVHGPHHPGNLFVFSSPRFFGKILLIAFRFAYVVQLTAGSYSGPVTNLAKEYTLS
jgi:hypothetical protein